MPPEAVAAAPAAPSAAPATSPAPPSNPTTGLLQSKIAALMEAVQKSLDQGKYAEAHLALSNFYGSADLPAELTAQINSLLDQLAGTVLYSRKHYLEPAYLTQPGDTLEKLAQKYNVPWQLLAKINGLVAPDAPSTDTSTKDLPLPIGRELKVLRGPFEAIVHLDRHELTLVVQNRYAGRFPIGVGRDQPKLDGNYTIREKTLNPSYYGPDGVTLGPSDARNPLGGAWIGLSDRIGIHGTNDPRGIGRDDNRGTICVSSRDLQDLYGILSVGSRVTVMR
jgi:LysM repeat protein